MAEAIQQAPITAIKPSVRAALLAAAIVCAGTLLLATFELSMADWPSLSCFFPAADGAIVLRLLRLDCDAGRTQAQRQLQREPDRAR
jgi:hypothetical protein